MTPLDVRKLVVGSEGTLGVAVGATLRTAQLPAATGGLLVSGSGYEPLVRLLQALPPGGYAAAEIMDASFLVHGDFPPEWTEPGGSTLLYVDVHARSESELSSLLRDADKAAKKMSGIRSIPMSSESERKTLFQCRQRASERINMDQDRWKASFIEDGTVPLEHLAEYLGFMGELLRARGIRYALYGHAADGNIHCSPFIDIRNLDHYRMIDEIAFLVAEKIAELGGTLSGEHGDGFVRTPFLRGVYGSGVYSLFTGVKRLFDPQGRFHPGIIVGPQNASIAHDLRFE
jgi:FAD/FMN-containing dehydrogenase